MENSFDLSKLASILGEKLDAATKFKLLDMIDPRPIELIDELKPKERYCTEEAFVQLVNDELDYIIIDDPISLGISNSSGMNPS